MAKDSIIVIGFRKDSFDKARLDRLNDEDLCKSWVGASQDIVDYYDRLDDYVENVSNGGLDDYWWYTIDTDPGNKEYYYHKWYGKTRLFARLSGWTHSDPALIWSLTNTRVYFYDEKNGKVEEVLNDIDKYEDREGYFCVKADYYDEAYRDLYLHDHLNIQF